MQKMSSKIVFFGSGPVAAESLRLLSQDFDVEAVVTKPQPPHHKDDFPVLKLAQELDLKIITTKDAAELSNKLAGISFESRVGVVIDYGILIPGSVIDSFPLGIVNSHFSLLPEWRGADPITFSILSGQKTTGVSLMLIVPALDEGPLLAQSPLEIAPDATTPQLTSKLIELSHQMLAEILPLYMAGKIDPAPQSEASIAESKEPTYSRKLEKQDGIIDWTKPAAQLQREVRAYLEWPRSRTVLGGTNVIIIKAHVADGSGQPGTVDTAGKQLTVYCGEGALVIDSLIPAGKKEMPAQAFLAGYKL
jgi:methionyl-tRNA formyltransferase